MTKINLKLDEYLKSRGISQYFLIQHSLINPTTIRAYRRNEVRRYDADVLEKICDTLGCNLSDIIECIDVDEKD